MDNSLLDSFCVCFASYPNSRSRESDTDDLPDYSGPVLSEKQQQEQEPFVVSVGAVPRVLPLKPAAYPVQPPPYYPHHSKTSSLEVKPLRLVRASRKRRRPPPPSYVDSYSHTLYNSVTTLSFEAPPPPYAEKMASNPVMPKLDDSASDLASSVDSRGRRRRRNKQQQLATTGGLKTGPVLPRLAETKPVRLQLGLNLDVEVELKARLQGDVSLTLLQ